MNNTEVIILVDKKVKEGKDTKQIYQEIANLKESQKTFKLVHNENKSLKLKIFNQEKQITNLKDQLAKQKKKMFNLTLKKDIEMDNEKDYNGTIANVFHLKRILSYLEENPRVIKTRIKEGCCMNFGQTNTGLVFLQRVNLIKSDGVNYEKEKYYNR